MLRDHREQEWMVVLAWCWETPIYCFAHASFRRAKAYSQQTRSRPTCNPGQAQHAWSCETSDVAERDSIFDVDLLVINLTLEHDIL
jgi:hypothetical protein